MTNPCRYESCSRTAEAGKSRCRTCRRNDTAGVPLSPSMRVLLIDIETAPMEAYIWSQKTRFVPIEMIKTPSRMLCFAAKWLGDPKSKTLFYSEVKDGPTGMVEAVARLLDEADAVMHFNGERFDVPRINREIRLARLSRPSPFKQIDLLKATYKNFHFDSHKLQWISTQLGLAGKAKHEGFALWRSCLAGDAGAWKRMEKYNKQDVILLEDLYHELQGWLPNLPNRRLYESADGCPDCGGKLVKAGFAYTNVSKFQQYRCSGCGSYIRSGKRIEGTDLRKVAS